MMKANCRIGTVIVIHCLTLALVNVNGLSPILSFMGQMIENVIPHTRFQRNYRAADLLETTELISKEGYGSQKANVVTEDGYILQIHRIINPRRNYSGPPLFMVHGLIAASDAWVSAQEKDSIGFLLSDAGFDVWLGNLRGNHYSKLHTKYKPNRPKFWDFSFHESGMYDLPACIDYILKTTGYKKLTYIGHSMGSTTFLVMNSMRTEYNDKIDPGILLAPVATTPSLLDLSSPLLRWSILLSESIKGGLEAGRIYEVLPRTPNTVQFVRSTCGPTADMRQDVCLDIFGSIFGEHRTNINRTTLGEKLKYIPAGTSAKTVHHLSQIYKNDFQMYDYGKAVNLKMYGAAKPPLYPLNKVRAPVGLYYGDNDPYSVNKLASMLDNLVFNKKITDYKFSHIDFFFGVNVKQILYSELISFLQDYHADKLQVY